MEALAPGEAAILRFQANNEEAATSLSRQNAEIECAFNEAHLRADWPVGDNRGFFGVKNWAAPERRQGYGAG